MPEDALFCLLEELYESLKSEAAFLSNVRNQVQEIRAELNRIQCFLEDADAKQAEYETVRNWIADIREFAYDVDDVLEKYTHKIERRKDRSIWSKSVALHKIGVETQNLMSRISSIRKSMKSYLDTGIRALCKGESKSSASEKNKWLRRSYSHLIDDDFVGLEADVNKMVAQFVDEENDNFHRVFAICGMGGLGKTTLARKVYRHSDVENHFQALAWASISQKWKAKDVLQRILTKLQPENRVQISMMRDEELVKELYKVQQSKKCLVVLDDIWSTNFWDSVKHAFPKGKGGSIILITTRKKDICAHIDPTCFFHEPRCLDAEESWKLLHKKVFPRINTPDLEIDRELETLGREMVSQCGGLPLAIIVLAGLLATRPNVDEWRRIHQNLNSQMRSGASREKDGGTHGVLALSYYDLPYQFKPCFLSLVYFPEDQKISARKLYQLWAAEDLITLEGNQGEETSMMEVGDCYLRELAQRYMVQVQLEESTGRIKSCRLHDLMRDTCYAKAIEENFLKTIPLQRMPEQIRSSSSSKAMSRRATRRLSITIDDDFESYLSTKEKSFQQVRSALFFSRQTRSKETTHFPPTLQSLCTEFTMLRVLHLENFSFGEKLPKAIGDLVHLRYLSLRHSHFQRLPSSIAKLRYLQTLDLRVNYFSYLTMPSNTWEFQNLRHLYLPPSHQKTYRLQLSSLRNLEILKNFDTQVSPIKDLLKLTKLQKLAAVFSLGLDEMEEIISHLAIREGRLRDTSFRIYYKFYSEKELNLLIQFLGCRHLQKLDLIGHISKLPEHHQFSQNLTKLTLRKSALAEDPLSNLEKLPKLNALSLRGGSFIGNKMFCSAQGFPLLKTLMLQGLPNLESWTVEKGALSNLTHLEIDGCEKLKNVPNGLKFLMKIQELAIINMPEAFQNRLDEEGDDFCIVQHIPCRKIFDTKKSLYNKPKMPISGQMITGLFQTIYPSIVPKEWKLP